MDSATRDGNPAAGQRTSLTDDEILFFDAFGFVVLRQHFSGEEIETINAEFLHAMNLTYKDSPFDRSAESSEQLQGVNLSRSSTPYIYSLPERPHLYEIAKQLFGEDISGHESSINLFVGDTRWHPDRSGSDIKTHRFGCKFCYYPGTLDGETGALRVIPGSHLPPFFDALRKLPGIGNPENIRNFPGLVCRTEPGDVIVFNLNCWHASCGGKPGRPQFAFVYYASPKTAQHEKEMRFQYTRNRQMNVEIALSNNKKPSTPTPEEYLNRGDSPLMTEWLVDRRQEFGFFDFDNEAYIRELLAKQENNNG
jgi:hypothetical protein